MHTFNFKIISILIILYPFALITGPFITDACASLVGLLFILNIFLKKEFNFLKSNINLFFFIIFSYLILSSLISSNIRLSLESSLFYFRHFFFCLGFAYCIMHKKKIFKYFLFSFLLMIVLIIFDSYLQYISGTNLTGHKFNGFRLSSFFGEELILGGFLARFFPIIIGIIFYFITNYNKRLYLVVITTFLLGGIIILSGERTAVALFIIYFIFMISFNNYKRFIFLLSFITFLIISLFIILTDKNIEKRIVNYTLNQFFEKKLETNGAILNDNINIAFILNNIKDISFSEISLFSVQHETIYRTAYKIFIDNKIFGIGPKNFREVCKIKKYQTFSEIDTSINGCQSHPHNFPIQILVETGFIGFILLLFIYYFIFIAINKNKSKINMDKNNVNFLKFSSLVSIIINLFPFIPSGNIFNNYLSCLIYLPVAVFFAIIYQSNEKDVV